MIDIVFVVPGNSKKIYQSLSNKYSAIEPPTWALLLADSVRNKGYKVGILDINAEKERISLGIKHLENDPVQEFVETNPLNSKVTGKIVDIDEKGLKIELNKEKQVFGFIKKSNLSNDKSENKIERFALEENIDSIILSIDSKSRTLNLSIKELEIKDEKEALSKYGSSTSGASLGDILGSVLKK